MTIPITYIYARRPAIKWSEFVANAPLAVIYTLNVASGLRGTSALSVPMFVALRRFTLFITMGLEYYLHGKRHDIWTIVSVTLMLTGALGAAITDLSFSISGYAAVFANNIMSAYYMILIKNRRTEGITREKTMLYNAMVAAPILSFSSLLLRDEWIRLHNFQYISNGYFQVTYFLSASLGVVVTHATFVCTEINDPLTTSVVGVMKNISTTLIGAFAFPDYVFNVVNALSLGVSTLGAITYADLQIRKTSGSSVLPHTSTPK